MLQGRLNQNSRVHIHSLHSSYLNEPNSLTADQSGDGIASMIRSAFEKRAGLFPGERHMPLILPSGKIELGAYIGPGTQVVKRLERGDVGKTPTDNVAKMHDINYTLAQNSKTKEEQLDKIREADIRMVNTLKKIQRGNLGGDNRFNIQAGMKIIQSKMALENRGLLNKSKFAGDLEELPSKDVELLEGNKRKLEQEGYGRPASGLKKKLLREQKRKTMTDKYRGKGFDIPKFITSDILPVIIDKLNIDRKHVSISKIQDLIKKFKVKNIPDIVKVVLPHLLSGHMKTNKMAGGTQGLKSGFKVLPNFVADGLGKLFMYLVKRKLKKGSSGSGLIQDLFTGRKAKKFWGDVSRGFKMVMKPASKVLAPILTIAGMPIAGTALGAAGELM